MMGYFDDPVHDREREIVASLPQQFEPPSIEIPINRLKVGARFRMGSRTGRLLYVNQSRAYVELDLPPVTRTFTDRKTGQLRTFMDPRHKQRCQSWAPECPVEPLEEK